MRRYRVTGRAALLAADLYLNGEVSAGELVHTADYLNQLERERERTLPLPPDLAEARATDPRLAGGKLEPGDLDLLLEELVLEAEMDPDHVSVPAYAWAREQVRRGAIPRSEIQDATCARDRALAAEDQALARRWIASRTGPAAVPVSRVTTRRGPIRRRRND